MDIDFYKEQLQAKEDMLARTTKFLVDVQQSLEEKNIELSNAYRSILDSINVAERLQNSLLPKIDVLRLFFKDAAYRILQQVSVGGDTIFIKNMNDGVVFGLLDATGHGIPAAMLSISCTLLLRELTSSIEINNPKTLLNLLDSQLCNAFGTHEFSTAQAEGIICSFSSKSKTLTYSSAKGKAFLSYKSGEIEELPTTKKSIGDGKAMDFQNFEIDLGKADKLLLYSDGLTDQFGGNFDKKFSRAQLLSLFQQNLDKSSTELVYLIETEHQNWKKNKLQTDDVSFMVINF